VSASPSARTMIASPRRALLASNTGVTFLPLACPDRRAYNPALRGCCAERATRQCLMVHISCHQLAPRVGDLAYNRDLSIQAIAKARADVIVLPELITSGYVLRDKEEADSVAVDRDDALFDEWAAAAARTGALVVAGFCERGAGGHLYNSAAVVDGSGLLAVYRKAHLWDREKLVFTPGDRPPPVLDVHGIRLGVLVCYDLEFPEMTRSLALKGAELVTVPTNWPRSAHPDDERPHELVMAMAAARANRMVIACCDRTGVERGQAWNEGTSIIGADGWVLASAPNNGIAEATVDLAATRDKTVTDHNDLLGDRRPELYA
jgi:predicted amidohydrolase